MVTLLDCILRIPSVIEHILDEQENAFAAFRKYIEDKIEKLDELVLVGSGTSNTASLTARPFMEKASGLRVRAI